MSVAGQPPTRDEPSRVAGVTNGRSADWIPKGSTARTAAITELTGPGAAFELCERSVRGTPMRVYRRAPSTLVEVLSSSAQFGDRDFLVYAGERTTFAEFRDRAIGWAHWLLADSGLRAGDRVGITMRNYPEWAPLFFGIQAAGMVAVPLNAWWSEEEFRYAIDDAGIRLMFADEQRAVMLATLGLELGVIVVRGEVDGLRSAERLAAGLPVGAELPECAITADDMATILYTSGTTGRPKGAMGSHRNHCTNAMNVALNAAAAALVADRAAATPASAPVTLPGTLLGFPIFHTAGLSGLYCSVAIGSKVGLLYRWDAPTAVALVAAESLTGVSGVPTMARQFSTELARSGKALPTLVGISSGGAPTPADDITALGRLFAKSIAPGNGYGLTETTSGITFNSGEDYFAAPDSVGRPVPGADVLVVDPESAKPLADGEIGELCFSGPNIFLGYYRLPEASAQARIGEFFRTGDLGMVREGLVYVLDRLKDMVLRGGENVYCVEVESVLHEHPAVADAAVFGMPDERLGERVVAVVLATQGHQVSERQLQKHVAS
ncbi:MAG: class I adenylate-forming enzyme family protein, partial [Sciscionella sp.]